MNTCNDIQAALRDRFDTGEALSGFQHDHVAACDACRRYHAELTELAAQLAVFEFAPPRDDLAAAVIRHVRAQRRIQSLRAGDYAAIGLFFGVAAVGAGWYWPVSFSTESWWSRASDWLAQTGAAYTATGVFDRLAAVVRPLNDALASTPSVSQPLLWTALAVCCVGAVAFNAYVAMRLRTAGD